MLASVISMLCTVPAVMMVLKLKGEEKRNRVEHLLARAVSRTKLIASFLLISLVVGFMVLLLAALGLWSAGSVVMNDPIALKTILKAIMVYLPAMWVMISLAILLIGVLPQGTVVIWLYLGYSFFVVYLGNLLQFPQWMAKLSPFGNVPKLPTEEINFAKIGVLTTISVIFVVIGFIGYNRRDIHS